ncbi:cytoplasmic protein [Bacillus sp. NPDC094106]|uniref:cytoplasmic protein n=1 Tax=Bacillus sp. NPDC094106 TaxID=3363949 RepID=UPI00381C6A95
MEKYFENAHRFCSRNKIYLEKDIICGCFYCLKIFNPNTITEWWDDNDTAVCPYCGIDSVIGEGSGFKITENFLKEMRQRWFD